VSLIKQSIPLIFSASSARGIAFLQRWIAAISLTITAYSDYSIYVSLFLSLIPLSTLSLSSTLSKISSLQERETLALAAASGIRITTIFSIISSAIFLWISPGELKNPTTAIIIFIGFLSQGIISVKTGVCLAHLDFKNASIIEIYDSALKFLFCGTYLIFETNPDAQTLFTIYTSSSIITILTLNKKTTITAFSKKSEYSALRIIRDCAGYALTSTIILAYFYYIRTSVYEIDKYLAAQLDFAILLYSIPKMIMAALAKSVIPISNSKHNNKLKIQKYATIFLLSGVILFLTITTLHDTSIVKKIFTILKLEEFTDSLIPLSVLILGSAFDLVFGLKSGINFSKGKHWLTFLSCLIAISALTPITKSICNQFGTTGAAALMSISYALFVAFMIVIEKTRGAKT